MGGFPPGVFAFHVGQQAGYERAVAGYKETLIEGVRCPRTEILHAFQGFPVIAPVPGADYLMQVAGVSQPPRLVYVVS